MRLTGRIVQLINQLTIITLTRFGNNLELHLAIVNVHVCHCTFIYTCLQPLCFLYLLFVKFMITMYEQTLFKPII